jgi:uncharacterized protein (TIGR04255 family)
MSVVIYRNPPVLSRSLVAIARVPREVFEMNLERLKAAFLPRFPSHRPNVHFSCDVEQVPGQLSLNVKQSMLVGHDFSKVGKDGPYLTVSIHPEQIRLTFERKSSADMRFEELEAVWREVLPLWRDILSVEKIKTVVVEYVNLLSQATTPGLLDDKGSILVGRALTIFHANGVLSGGIVPPYDCRMGLKVDVENNRIVNVRVLGLQNQVMGKSAVRLDFQALSDKPAPGITLEQSFDELRSLHDIVNDQFERVFSEDAKKTFDPLPQDTPSLAAGRVAIPDPRTA